MKLLYDGDCGFCTRSANRIAPHLRGVEVRPLQSVDLLNLGVDPDRAMVEIPYVGRDGAVTYGSEAIANALADGGPRTRLLGRLMLSFPARNLAARIYPIVANHRHELPGGSSTCELPR